ncbi:hypothetical protein H1C71_036346 [Ictidomys tridecemlineatus]|nr:hypothetical protein H1C71_036346 [Ictidomys tridecemlineatus]
MLVHCLSDFLAVRGEEGDVNTSLPAPSLAMTVSFPECTELPLWARYLHSIEVGSSSAHGVLLRPTFLKELHAVEQKGRHRCFNISSRSCFRFFWYQKRNGWIAWEFYF